MKCGVDCESIYNIVASRLVASGVHMHHPCGLFIIQCSGMLLILSCIELSEEQFAPFQHSFSHPALRWRRW